MGTIVVVSLATVAAAPLSWPRAPVVRMCKHIGRADSIECLESSNGGLCAMQRIALCVGFAGMAALLISNGSRSFGGEAMPTTKWVKSTENYVGRFSITP